MSQSKEKKGVIQLINEETNKKNHTKYKKYKVVFW